ncbi:MAG: hypothetical protein AABZ39_15480 [Spirochaetota bacterium]
MIEHKVIGYYAYFSGINVLCDADGCIIAGSEELMTEYIDSSRSKGRVVTIKKTRYGVIKNAMLLGAAYAFDIEAYTRFKSAADKDGLPLLERRYTHNESKAELIRVIYDNIMPWVSVRECASCGREFHAPASCPN